MNFFLGVDVGGTKTHALIANQKGKAVGFAQAGPGNWEAVGFEGLTEVLKQVIARACANTGISISQIIGAGLGIAGYDWPSQKKAHLEAIFSLGLTSNITIVNDAVLGIAAGSEKGWGISIVSGTGCNCRGLSRDHKKEGRVVGGAGYWSGEAAGGYDILSRAMRAVTFQWAKRGPNTALSEAFLRHTGAKDLDDLIEGAYLGRYKFDTNMLMLVFEAAKRQDPQALNVMCWAGEELGGMALGVANQLGITNENFDVVLIGSIFDGHPLIAQSVENTIKAEKPGVHLVRLVVPPVVGGVLLGMEISDDDLPFVRTNLINSTGKLLGQDM